MDKEKRFYYMKLRADSMYSKEIKKLRKIAGGDTYVLIYLKIQLLSIQSGGMLKFEGTEPDFAEQLSIETDEEYDNVKVVLNFLVQNKLIEDLGNDEYLLPHTAPMIGSETAAAERMRRMRDRKGRNNVTPMLQSVTQYKRIEKREKSKENKPPLPPKGELFGLFWKSYPKRVGKGAAEKAFSKIKPSKETLNQMLDAIEKAKKSDQWKKDGGQFIPYPATWLNQKRWEDELEIEVDDGYVTLWDGSARVPRYQCIKTERGWEEKSRIGEPSHLKGE
jgi:predicted phage replisome organizer